VSFGQYSQEPKPAKPSMPAKTKRLKYVFDDPTHVWANPLKKDGSGFEQDHARNATSNIYFKTSSDGTRVLYSYRDSYPIASLFTHKKKQVVLLRSGKPYSVTTAKHFNMSQAASRHIETRFSVPYVTEHATGFSSMSPRDSKPDAATHAANLADYVARITEQIEAFGKARSSYNLTTYHANAESLASDARAYAKFFGLKLPKLPKLPVIDPAKLATIRERERVADAKRDAKRAVERAEWEAKRIERERLQKLSEAERIAEWRAGKRVDIYLIARGEYALLRVKLDESTKLHNVETSQGVTVPVLGRAGAARLLRFLQARHAANDPFKTNGHTEHIGNFTVSSFGPLADIQREDFPENDWLLVAGCHRILFSEISSIADAVRSANDADTSVAANTNNVLA
jgi:hypothetical protein